MQCVKCIDVNYISSMHCVLLLVKANQLTIITVLKIVGKTFAIRAKVLFLYIAGFPIILYSYIHRLSTYFQILLVHGVMIICDSLSLVAQINVAIYTT